MHSFTSSFRSPTNLFSLIDPSRSGPLPSLELEHSQCWSPTTSTSDNGDSSSVTDTEANADALEVAETLENAIREASAIKIPDGLETALESVVKRMPTEALEKLIQDQLQDVVKRNRYTTYLCKQMEETDKLLIKYQQKIDVLQKHVNDLSLVIENYTSGADGSVQKPPMKLARNVGLQVRIKPVLEASSKQKTAPEMETKSSIPPVPGNDPFSEEAPHPESSISSDLNIRVEIEESSNCEQVSGDLVIDDDPSQEIDLTESDDEANQRQQTRPPVNANVTQENLPTAVPLIPSDVNVPCPAAPTKVMTIIHDVTSLDYFYASGTAEAATTQNLCKERNVNAISPARADVAFDHRSPLAGSVQSTVRDPLSSSPFVNSAGNSLSSQSLSESVRSSGFIPSSSVGSVARSAPSFPSVALTESVPTARMFPPPAPLSAPAPTCFQNCTTPYSCHLNRKRRLPCTVSIYNPSTVAYVENYNRLIKETWYDRRKINLANDSLPESAGLEDPTAAKKTVAVVPPVMMSPPTHIERWLMPKSMIKAKSQMEADRKIEQTGMYNKWRMPLLAGGVLTRPSIKEPLILKSHQSPHLSGSNIRANLPNPTNDDQEAITRNGMCPPLNPPHLIAQQKTSPPPPCPSSQLPLRSLQSRRMPELEKLFSNRYQSVIVSPVARSDLPPPAQDNPDNQQSTTEQKKGIPALIAINDNTTPLIIKNQPIIPAKAPTVPPPADPNLDQYVQFKPVLKLKRINEDGVRVKWGIPNLSQVEMNQILSYELFARQDAEPPEQWRRMAVMKALPLPMGCSLSNFARGYRYFFRIRTVIRCDDESHKTAESPYSQVLSMVFD